MKVASATRPVVSEQEVGLLCEAEARVQSAIDLGEEVVYSGATSRRCELKGEMMMSHWSPGCATSTGKMKYALPFGCSSPMPASWAS
jgi:hypothetical protein